MREHGIIKGTLTFDYDTINKVKEVSLNLSLSSGRLKDLMEILDLHRHQIVQSLALLSTLVTSLFKTCEIKHYLHHIHKHLKIFHTKYKLTHFKTFNLSIDLMQCLTLDPLYMYLVAHIINDACR